MVKPRLINAQTHKKCERNIFFHWNLHKDIQNSNKNSVQHYFKQFFVVFECTVMKLSFELLYYKCQEV
jgi:hypothetical protein